MHKAFVLVALGAVTAMALSPFALLDKPQRDRFAGKMVRYDVYTSKIRSIDPATAGDTSSASLQGNFYEGLYTYHYLKRPVTVVPQLAAAMPEVSEDGLTYTIRLRDDVLYARNPCFGVEADGRAKTRPVEARDFVLAFKRIADFHVNSRLALTLIAGKIEGLDDYRDATRWYPAGDFGRYDDLSIAGVEAVDDRTLRIRLTTPFPQLRYVLAMASYAPIPRELIDYHLASQDDGDGGREPIPMAQRTAEIRNHEAIVSTGPYILTEWLRGGRIVLERNPDFREQHYPAEGAPGDRAAGLLDDAGRRVPFIDVQYLTYVGEDNPAWMMFREQLSDTSGIPRDIYDSVITPSQELTDQWRRRGIRLVKMEGYPAVYWYGVNLRDPVLGSSKSLRQALLLAYDVESHISLLMNGRGRRAVTMVPSSFEGYRQAGPSPYARFDPDAARAKLADARRELEAAGVIGPGAPIPPLTLDTGSTDESARRMAEFAKEQFARIGITLEVEMNDWPTLQQKVDNGQVQLYMMGWHADYPDPENFLQNYYGPNIAKGTNTTRYSNPAFDALYQQAAVMEPSDERTALYVKMLRILNEDCPVLLLHEPVSFVLINDWVKNYKPHPIGYGNTRYMRIDTDARRRAGGR